jgi:hypothetical protein
LPGRSSPYLSTMSHSSGQQIQSENTTQNFFFKFITRTDDDVQQRELTMNIATKEWICFSHTNKLRIINSTLPNARKWFHVWVVFMYFLCTPKHSPKLCEPDGNVLPKVFPLIRNVLHRSSTRVPRHVAHLWVVESRVEHTQHDQLDSDQVKSCYMRQL